MSKLTPTSKVKLNNGYEIPITGFGVYQTDPKETYDIVYKALETGYRHIDSAIYYQNEKESGDAILQFLKDHPEVKRSDIFYTTKVAFLYYDDAKKAIKESIEKVKGLKYIDLFLIHAPIPNKEARIGTYKALQEAVDEGFVRSIGVSNYGTKHLDELFAWEGLKYKPVANQLELHPWLPRKDLQAYAKKYDHILEAYSPLTQAKKFNDPELVAIAKKHNVSPAQVLLRWSYAQGFVPLPKTVTPARLAPNFTALNDVQLDQEDLATLDKPDSYEVLTWDPTRHVDTNDYKHVTQNN